jgi:ABC-2 type transport system permease protein
MTATVAMPPDVRVTQARVLASEWVKFRSLRSTYLALAAAVVAVIGFGSLFAGVVASNWATMEAVQRARINPAAVSLRGVFLAQLIIGVLGALVVSGEYGTGMIRSSLAAAPTRLPVLWAKAAVFAAVTYVVMTVSAFVAFFCGQALLGTQHIETNLSEPGVLRAVIGAGLYLTVVGLLGVAFGWIIRHTAGAISTLMGLLLVVPVLAEALPESWAIHVNPYLPSNAGQEIFALRFAPGDLAPWTGFVVFCAYLVVAIAAAAVLLTRRDA